MDATFLIPLGLIVFCVVVAILLQPPKPKPPEEKQRHPDLKDKIVFFSHGCGDITWKYKKETRNVHIAPSVVYKNKALQKTAKTYIKKTPINTKLRITDFAWDMVDGLNLAFLLPRDWYPVGAYHFNDGIVMVRYMERPPEKGDPNTAVKDLYFAASDGHIIYWKS